MYIYIYIYICRKNINNCKETSLKFLHSQTLAERLLEVPSICNGLVVK